MRVRNFLKILFVAGVVFILSAISTSIYAQSGFTITGKLVSSVDGKPIELAEVRLLKPDSVLFQSTYTSREGTFQLSAIAGNYILEAKYLGRSLYGGSISIDKNTNLGTLNIEPATSEGNVTVTSRRKLIERKIDRIVFNVESSVMAVGVDLTEVLKNTPLVKVSDYSVGIVGKSTVVVMIDDRIIHMSGVDLINYLKSLRSNDVAKIEVITAPPAKYIAEGNSGIINIILKKNSLMGWSGNFSTSYIQASYPGFANNLTVNYRSNKVHTTVRVRQYDRASKAIEDIDVIGPESLYSLDTRKDMDDGLGANINFLYKISKAAEIGFIYDIGLLHANMDIQNKSEYLTNGQLDSTLYTTSRHRNSITSQSLNTFYNLKLDSVGRKLGITVNYFSNAPRPEVNFETLSSTTQYNYRVLNTSVIDYSILSGQIDLFLPFKPYTVETGGMITDFTNNSDVRYLNFQNSEFILNTDRSNIFNYDEKNYALYVSANRDFGKLWSIKAGLRYEYSEIDGFSVTTKQRTQYSYAKVFPTVYMRYKAGKDNTLTLNYSKRINRPGFRALNPFRWYSNPFTFYTGNPLLQPSFNHNVELAFLHKDFFSISLYGQKLVNGFGRVVTYENSIKEVNFKNYLTQHDVGSNVSLYFNPKKWWQVNTDAVASYSTSKSSIPEVVADDGFAFYYTINNTFTLNKPKLVLYLNFWNELPTRRANLYSENLYSLTTGLRFSMFKGKGRVNASVDDIFKGLVSRGKIYFDRYFQQYENYYDSRRFTISFTYQFGNKNVNANSRQIRFTERNRIN
ncbi:MAG TPA: outer membrane beta-barrel family protein [Chitinophagaceae bacterium]